MNGVKKEKMIIMPSAVFVTQTSNVTMLARLINYNIVQKRNIKRL